MFNNLLSKLSDDEKSLFKTIKYTVSILVILIMLTYGLKFITKDSDIMNIIGVFLLVISFFWSVMMVKQGLSVLIKDNESNDDSDK
jgi:uncharacterized Tic20 family protein